MGTEAHDENRTEKQPEETVRGHSFLSGIFGRKQSSAERKNAVITEIPAPTAPSYIPREDDYLGQLRAMRLHAPALEGPAEEWLLPPGEQPAEEQWKLIHRLQTQAENLISLLQQDAEAKERERKAAEAALAPDAPDASEPSAPEQEEAVAPVDATCELLVSADDLTAWVCLLPPILGGAEVTAEQIASTLAAEGIVFGVDQSMPQQLAGELLYFKIVPIAHGIPAVDGKDGGILDLIPRETKVTYDENEKGTVDYREITHFNHIQAGDVICNIFAPTDPVQGTDVRGRVIMGNPGKAPVVPGGKNTQLSDDGSKLIAAIDGQVSFFKGKFTVDSVITINGNVDATVGNLDVIGSIVVHGDVLEGFTVKASADINVSGIVEGSKLIAGGNIQLNHGMNGNQRGVIKAKGTIIAQFLENCTAYAHDDIKVQSIINCIISSDGIIKVTDGRGVIIGGSVTACKSVEAKIIGNASHRVTEIILGSTPDFLQRQTKLAAEAHALRSELEEMAKSVAYLEKSGTGDPSKQTRLTQINLRRSVLHIQLAKKDQRLGEMRKMLENMKDCSVRSGVIYPGVRVTIGLETRPVLEKIHSCYLYSGKDGIVFGTK